MISPNIDACRALAVQHGLPLQFVVKEFYVMDVLAQLSSREEFRKDMVFKGGTALSKAYLGGVQRFSEDLDFDMDAPFSEIRRRCGRIAPSLEGYSSGPARKVGKTLQFYCRYNNPIGGTDNVRIDISPKKIISSAEPAVGTATSLFSQRSVSGFLVYSLEDLAARKLCALASRCEGKDVYDCHTALPLCGRMRQPIARMLESEGMEMAPDEFVENAIAAVEKADAKKLQSLANPFIPAALRPQDWRLVKGNLVAMLSRLL
ncbi:MAG: nucleotidyl transferase AbiEii/AbiGii toxin family protein [Candidatus Micrarchaeota archaeon]|nr:nucleotidyl transferase AbiEii/AbiGii toxin family protein [Candidatus Micrarchaeota archaeon]